LRCLSTASQDAGSDPFLAEASNFLANPPTNPTGLQWNPF
jgi:hypothetical protein